MSILDYSVCQKISDLLESKSPGVLQTKVHTRQRNLHKSVPMTNIAEQHSSSVLSPHLVRRKQFGKTPKIKFISY